MNAQDIYTVGEVAKRLKVSEHTIRRWCRDGQIVCHKLVGGGYRIPMDSKTRLPIQTGKGEVNDG